MSSTSTRPEERDQAVTYRKQEMERFRDYVELDRIEEFVENDRAARRIRIQQAQECSVFVKMMRSPRKEQSV